MIPAYDENILAGRHGQLGRAFDYALNDCGLPVGLFMDFFATSEAAALRARHAQIRVADNRREELVAKSCGKPVGRAFSICRQPHCAAQHPNTGPGWVLTYCQWARGVGSRIILDVLSTRRYRATAPDFYTKPTKADLSTINTTSGPPINRTGRATPGCTRSACAPDQPIRTACRSRRYPAPIQM